MFQGSLFGGRGAFCHLALRTVVHQLVTLKPDLCKCLPDAP